MQQKVMPLMQQLRCCQPATDQKAWIVYCTLLVGHSVQCLRNSGTVQDGALQDC